MLKIDWTCAIGGALVGYYAKGKVMDAKVKFRRLSSNVVETLREAMEDQQIADLKNQFQQSPQSQQSQQAPQGSTKQWTQG